MLELKHISYRVSTPDGEQDILKDISITIPDEKLVVFTGPNGGGKTTMAKVIMGLASTFLQVPSVGYKIGSAMTCRCPAVSR